MIEVQCQNFFKCSSVPPRPSGALALLACLVFHLFPLLSPPNCSSSSIKGEKKTLQILAQPLALAHTRALISLDSECESCILKCRSPPSIAQTPPECPECPISSLVLPTSIYILYMLYYSYCTLILIKDKRNRNIIQKNWKFATISCIQVSACVLKKQPNGTDLFCFISALYFTSTQNTIHIFLCQPEITKNIKWWTYYWDFFFPQGTFEWSSSYLQTYVIILPFLVHH